MTVPDRLFYWAKVLTPYLFFSILLLYLAPTTGHSWDVQCWTEWSLFIYDSGLSNIYKSWTDYLPLYHYVLFLYGKVQGSVENIVSNINSLKIITLLFELGSTLILFKLLEAKFKDINKSILLSLFYFLNFAVLYNSMLWNQVDGIMTFFVFASLIPAYFRKGFLAVLCYVLAINFKLQAIIFLPLFMALVIPLITNATLKSIILSVLAIALIQLLIILPFMLAGDLPRIWNVVAGSVDKYPKVSMNAYNVWYLFMQGDLMQVLDSGKFGGITYKSLGLIMFFISSFFALLFLLKPYYQFDFQRKPVDFAFDRILISGALIPLLFFFFNTQMHERYSHPALIFLAAYALLYNRPWILGLGSIAYFLNMEAVFRHFKLNNYETVVFAPSFVAFLYLILIGLLFFDLYKGQKSYQISYQGAITS